MKKSKYILGIECDGATYHSSRSARERDIHRQRYLESRGWKIVRIWSRDWWKNPELEIKKIEEVIGQLGDIKGIQRENDNNLGRDKSSKDKDKEKGREPLKLVKKEEKIRTPDINKTSSEKEITQGNSFTIGFGDTVGVTDIDTKNGFVVKLESNSANRNLMKEIELRLLGLQINQIFSFTGARYQVISIEKRANIS